MKYASNRAIDYAIKFVDFVPARISPGGLFSSAQYETLDKALEEMDKWIKDNPRYTVISVETVVLPNIHSTKEEGSQDTELIILQSDTVKARWHQFFRVWYK